MKKKMVRRDRQALVEIVYLDEKRHGKATTVAQAARQLGVSKQVTSSRLSTLHRTGAVDRIPRGIYASKSTFNAGTGQLSDSLDDMLRDLQQQKAEIEAKIAMVKDVIALRDAWKDKP